MPENSPKNRWRLLSLTMIGLGLSVSVYLFVRSVLIQLEQHSSAIDVCSKLFGASCDATLINPDASVLGIPIAGWGVVYYVVLTVLMVLGWVFRETFERETSVAAVVLSLAGVGASALLSVWMVSGSVPVCPLCIVIHVDNLLLLPVLKKLSGLTVRQLLSSVVAAGKYLAGGKVESPTEGSYKIGGFINVALVAVVALQWVYVETELRKLPTEEGTAEQNFEEVIGYYDSIARQEIPQRPDDPRFGPAEAPVQLVLFSSFRCRGCQTFSKRIRDLAQSFRGQVAITYKHFPLHEVCTVEPHPDVPSGSCATAFAAEAARQQGKFWELHDELFSISKNATEEAIQNCAQAAGLDMERFTKNRQTRQTREKVVADNKLAEQLGVTATPTVFLNGWRLRNDDLSTQTLSFLVLHQIVESKK